MLTLKNKRLIVIGIFLLVAGILLFTIAEHMNNMPEDNPMSSGNSVVKNNTVTIDNYANVMNYKYTLNASTQSKKKNLLLKDMDFSFVENINIPGMPDTKERDVLNNYIFSTNQCPQGICFTDEFVFITSYSVEDDCLGEFMVFDRTTGEYLITLGMDDKSHLGGIAFDGKNVWVCNSSNKTIERISYDFVCLMARENKGEVVDATNLVDVYRVKNVPSCITYYNGRLWIGTHNIWSKSHMVAYYYNQTKDTLEALSVYNIPKQVQGIAFDENGKVYFSTSYGRQKSSYIKVYESVFTLTSDVNAFTEIIEMPPCSEEIVIHDGKLYVLFESAGEKYYEGTDGNGVSLSPLDKILEISIKETLQ